VGNRQGTGKGPRWAAADRPGTHERNPLRRVFSGGGASGFKDIKGRELARRRRVSTSGAGRTILFRGRDSPGQQGAAREPRFLTYVNPARSCWWAGDDGGEKPVVRVERGPSLASKCSFEPLGDRLEVDAILRAPRLAVRIGRPRREFSWWWMNESLAHLAPSRQRRRAGGALNTLLEARGTRPPHAMRTGDAGPGRSRLCWSASAASGASAVTTRTARTTTNLISGAGHKSMRNMRIGRGRLLAGADAGGGRKNPLLRRAAAGFVRHRKDIGQMADPQALAIASRGRSRRTHFIGSCRGQQRALAPGPAIYLGPPRRKRQTLSTFAYGRPAVTTPLRQGRGDPVTCICETAPTKM